MHLPDSVLSPTTALIANAVMVPLWVTAHRQVKAKLSARETPLLALGSAFTFTIMLFNIPAPGGTTAHAVGATLLAILLGPWAALIGVSVALAIQALFFGDGGLWAYGANCFTMAFVQPFVGYSVYRLCCYLRREKRGGNSVAGAIGAYVGINLSALTVAVLLGVQPALAHSIDGKPLYFPFGLSVTIPAMLVIHLLTAGIAEAVITALVVQSAETLNLPLFDSAPSGDRARPAGHSVPWLLLCTLLALSPLGLIAQGSAWGEWDSGEMRRELLQRGGNTELPAELGRAEARSYKGVAALQKYGGNRGAWGYLGSGFLGAGAITGLMLAGGKRLAKRAPYPFLAPSLPSIRVATPSGRLPDWLLVPSSADHPRPTTRRRRASRYLERTLGEIASSMGRVVYGDRWSESHGLLQTLDPRAKLLGLGGLILLTGATRAVSSLVSLSFIVLGLAVASKIPLSILIKRSIGMVALFGAAVALPALLLALYQHSTSGQIQAITLLLRLADVVAFSSLLSLTTRWNDLLGGLRRLGVPRSVTALVAMSYRYLLLSLQTANDIFFAHKSRLVGVESAEAGRRFVGFSVTAFFGKTLSLVDEIHQALLSRGFRGDFPQSALTSWRVRDSAWLLAVVALTVWIGGR